MAENSEPEKMEVDGEDGNGIQNVDNPVNLQPAVAAASMGLGDINDSMDTSSVERAQPSAPPKTAKVKVKVNWQEPLPEKWNSSLQKALQTWCNSDLSKIINNCEVHSVTIMEDDPHCAVVQIMPFQAVEVLKNYSTAKLTFKVQNKNLNVTANVSLVEAMQDEKDPSLKVNGTMTSAGANNVVNISAVNSASNGTDVLKTAEMTTGTNSAPCTVPLFHYWYIQHAYKNELEKIMKLHGVDIFAEVSVSFKTMQSTNPDSVSKASDEFQKLVQGCDIKNVTIPYTHIDEEIVRETMHSSQSETTKVVMSLSASNVQVFGPKTLIDMIDKKVNGISPEIHLIGNANKMDAVKNVYPQMTSSLDMDMRDLQNQIEMDKIHWDLIKLSYGEQLSYLQTKFGVSFNIKDENYLIVKVKAQSKEGQQTDLENHAMRSLIQLYQKLALTTVSCELKDPRDTDIVTKIKAILGKQQYCVVAVDVYGPWRLVGLPEHLGPSVKDIEKKIGKRVFDEETKKLIRYAEDIPQGRAITWEDKSTYGQGAAGGSIQDEPDPDFNAKSQEKRKKNCRPDSKGQDGEEEQCVICMDNINNKKKLKCGHEFCKDCIDEAVKHSGCICPVCKKVFGKMEGNQPHGTMTVSIKKSYPCLPGYHDTGTIEIIYCIPDGTQTSKHPNPGKRYHGAQRTAYLPDNKEGNHVLKLLQRAFEQKLIFTVGTSTTSGLTNVVTWNDIHHKTSMHGGPERYGYPDPDYLKRVKDELKAKGIE